MTILGLHHISIISADAQRTIDFYVRVLGLRLVKQTVNFDDPTTYHLYFGDEIGRPATVVTFFEIPRAARGKPGIGGTHHFALIINNTAAQLKWKRRLMDMGLKVDGPFDRKYFTSIYFTDPDGTILEIATKGPGWTVDEEADKLGQKFIDLTTDNVVGERDDEAIAAQTWNEPVPEITPDMALNQGMHHITVIGTNIERTAAFYEDVLGMRRLKMTANYDDPQSQHWYWGVGDGKPGTLITYFERDPRRESNVRMGAGQTHHFALAVANEDVQLEMRQHLIDAGYRVSEVKDRTYFKSIYTRDPDGQIVELATLGPGFLVDESVDELGSTLKLPPWLEPQREQLTSELSPLEVPARKKV